MKMRKRQYLRPPCYMLPVHLTNIPVWFKLLADI